MAERDTPFDDPTARFAAGRFGMWIFLVVLAVVFASTLLGYIVVRVDNGQAFIPANAPPPPGILLVSTAVLIVSSWTMQRALRFGRTGDPRQGGMMVATSALALVFLGVQLVAWAQLYEQNLAISDNLYAWTFYVLTALHAAHVVGGLPPLAITTWRASQGRYGPDDHRGITYCAMYWHFLDGAWIVLYATLWLGSMR
ncbi:MAG: heme-copper oxidase subunit III [Planctomycetota bacterium]